MRLQKGHVIVRDCDFTTAQRIVDHTTELYARREAVLRLRAADADERQRTWVCGGCDDTDDTTCGPVVDMNEWRPAST